MIVKGKGDAIPSEAADATELKKEEERYRHEAVTLAKNVKPPAHTVSLGASGPGGVELFAMFPDSLTVSPGTTVEFAMPHGTREVHTAAFGPPDYVGALASSFQTPVPDPAALYPE